MTLAMAAAAAAPAELIPARICCSVMYGRAFEPAGSEEPDEEEEEDDEEEAAAELEEAAGAGEGDAPAAELAEAATAPG